MVDEFRTPRWHYHGRDPVSVRPVPLRGNGAGVDRLVYDNHLRLGRRARDRTTRADRSGAPRAGEVLRTGAELGRLRVLRQDGPRWFGDEGRRGAVHPADGTAGLRETGRRHDHYRSTSARGRRLTATNRLTDHQ